jgi:GxxExxY protein
MTKFFYPELSHEVIGCAIEVHKALGFGLPEICYKNALLLALTDRQIQAESEVKFKVHFKERLVGYYKADIVVERKMILELKVADQITSKHQSQLLVYLKLANLRVGYVLTPLCYLALCMQSGWFANMLLEKQRLITDAWASSGAARNDQPL